MVLVIAALVLAVSLVVALVVIRRSTTTTTVERPDIRLPVGADAALWSIVEAVPDPRNHLALTRDLTGEVRISGTILDPEFRAATLTPPPRPAPAGSGSVRIIAERVATERASDAPDAHHLDRAS
jgi:hypothetical protein